jgi:hypothetical protein
LPSHRGCSDDPGNIREYPAGHWAFAGKVSGYAVWPEGVENPDNGPVIPIKPKRRNEYAIDQTSYYEQGDDRQQITTPTI